MDKILITGGKGFLHPDLMNIIKISMILFPYQRKNLI